MSLSFSEESLQAATSAVDRLEALWVALGTYASDAPDDPSLGDVLVAGRAGLEAGLDDDLNISPALGAVFDLVRELNRRIAARSLSVADARRARETLRDIDRVLALLPDDDTLEPELAVLLEARAAARASKEWAESDRLRAELLARGISVEDSRDGQRWRRNEVHGG
jgi:cysteinyl-tRNA synthetase